MDKLFHHDVAVVGDWTLASILLVLWLVVGFFTVRVLFALIRRSASRSPAFQFGNVLAQALPVPFYVLLVLTGFMFSSRFAPFLQSDEDRILRLLKILLCLAVVYLADKALLGLLRGLEGRYDDLRNSHVFFSALIHIVVWFVGILFVLDSSGVSITPLLASLGVGSLAVALGFQSTFANLFSGIYLLVDKPAQVGDFVKLSTGEEGTVEMIGWRSTRIRTLADHWVVLPNSKVAENLLLNLSRPRPACSFSVEVGVDYGSDLEQVEKVTLETALEIQRKAPGASRTFQPSVSFHTFGSSAVQFSVNLEAERFAASYGVKHAFIKALHQRYRKERIVMPFPIQTVEFRGPVPTERKE